MFVIGKSIGGGMPCARMAYRHCPAARRRTLEADLVDVGGVGSSFAGDALSTAAMRATLEHVLTDDAFTR